MKRQAPEAQQSERMGLYVRNASIRATQRFARAAICYLGWASKRWPFIPLLSGPISHR